jgi:2,4-dienoyl-CoA reductase-like NADH-dependent reductase (Old Yellow Enzyme family)
VDVLFEPLALRGLTIANRVWMSPMCQYSCAASGADVGAPTDWHLVHLGARAVGGAGLILAEATAVTPDGRISPYDTGLWNDRQRDAFARIATFVAAQGSVPGIQLAHAGRKASTDLPWSGGDLLTAAQGGWQPVGPSPLAYGPLATPVELSAGEIDAIVAAFGAAARRARDAGMQVVEIHGAHGYLLHEFASPHSNRRFDSYGGSFDNRTRLALEVVRAVRATWPAELPLFYRLSATDWAGDDPDLAWTLDDSVRLAGRLAEAGVDLVDVSSGGNVPDVAVVVGPGYQVPFAATIRTKAGVATGAVGMITSAAQAERIVAGGEADAVLLGRRLLVDPYWPQEAAREVGGTVVWPEPYGRS